jgi:hypothetical protein
MTLSTTLSFVIALVFLSFSTSTAQTSKNPAAMVQQIETAMGGVENYNNIKFITWDFAKRKLYWNKWTGDVRIESPKDTLVILVNVNTVKGKVFKNNELLNENAAKKWLNKGKNWWINDSYWLVMPWKLQDPGVTLKYVKTEALENGNTADVLQLTFTDVGVTPENKYHIFVDQTDNLIKQWAFFTNFNDDTPRFTMPWDNYQNAGNILLSFNRSKFGPKNVVVAQAYNERVFTDLNYD